MPMMTASAELPRNVAFAFWPGHAEPQLMQDQTEVELELLGPAPSPGHAGLATARTPLEPGRAYRYQGATFTVQDILDEEAPVRPTLSGAELAVTEHDSGCLGGSSCGERTVILTARPLAGPDNHTPTERLTYALYLGSTPEAARKAVEPARFGVLENGARDRLSTRSAPRDVARDPGSDAVGSSGKRDRPFAFAQGPTSRVSPASATASPK